MKKRDWLLLALGAAAGGGGVYWLRARAQARAVRPNTGVVVPQVEPEERGRRIALGPNVQARPAETAELSEPRGARVEARWAQKNKAAIEALEKGEHARAVELFEECRTAVPGEAVFAANLAEALARLSLAEYERGGAEDRTRSFEHLRQAVVLAPERDDLKQRLAQLERLLEAERGFWTDTSEHFELAYDGDRSDLLMSAYEITKVLEVAYQEFGELFGTWPVESGRAKIRVVLYRRAGFHDATGIGHWAGGLFDGSIRVPLEDLGREKVELERVLRHEIAHAFVVEVGGRSVPGWLNEGLAQRLESSDLLRRARDVENARKKLAGKELLPLARLQESLGLRDDPEEIALAYAQALALTEHIERVHGERLPFLMVAGCRAAVPIATTFQRRAGIELETALADLAREL